MELIEAKDHKQLFIKLFNRYTRYAPYTVHLDEAILDRYILGFGQNKENRVLIGTRRLEYGMIHYGIHDEDEGMIYLLFADSNQMAIDLLNAAEQWFAEQGVRKIMVYLGHPSPYQYILHGSEPYCWAGNYHANNAFRRLAYDLELDVLVMFMQLTPAHAKPHCQNIDCGFSIQESMVRNDDLAITGTFSAIQNNKTVGVCGYHYLKAFAQQQGTKCGQVDIWLDESLHGTGLAGTMMTLAHSALARLKTEHVMLATNQALFRAIQFYEKTGYTMKSIKAYSYVKMLG